MKLIQVAAIAAALSAAPAAFATQDVEKDFVWYCESDEATKEQKITVSALYDAIGLSKDTTPCKDAMDVLANVAQVEMPGKNVSDLAPFTGIAFIETLDLSNNQVANLATLPDLPQLLTLKLASNKLTKLPDFSRFPKLEYLSLSHNAISSIDNTAGFSNVQSLFIAGLGISDLGFLTKLSKLRELGLGSYESPAVLDTLPKLDRLSAIEVTNQKLTNLDFLKKTPQVSSLNVSGNQIKDLGPISSLRRLSDLDVSNNAIAEIATGVLPRRLGSLALGANPIKDFGFLKKVSGVSGVLSLTDLEALRWSDLSHLVRYVRTNLDLSRSHLTSIDLRGNGPVEWQMRNLHLKDSKIKSLAPFKRISIPMLRGFSGPAMENKTEENCPTTDVPGLVSEFCAS